MTCAIKLAFNVKQNLENLGILLNDKTGHIRYARTFIPLVLNYELLLVRHGETYGNCGQITAVGEIDHQKVQAEVKDKARRIFQGNVDHAVNQLTPYGRLQADAVAKQLEDDFVVRGWVPDIIFHSPLTRAHETGLPFVQQQRLQARYVVHEQLREMSFGAWENRRVCDLPDTHPGHLLYKEQNALVVESGLDVHGHYQRGECFAETLLNASTVLKQLNEEYAKKRVIFFSHSLFGAACGILLGKGRLVEDKSYLAFDGVNYLLPHATPIAMNF